MSDYFGALMRSSGMTIAERMLPVTAPRDDVSMPADSDLPSADSIGDAMTPPSREFLPSSLRRLEVPDTAPPENSAQPMSMPPDEDAKGGRRVVPKSAATAQARGPSAPTVNETAAQAADARLNWHPPQVPGRNLLRAAMEWVEGGPQLTHAKPFAEPMIALAGKQFPRQVANEEPQAQSSLTFDDEARSDLSPGIVRRARPAAVEQAEPPEPQPRLAQPAARRADPIPLAVAQDRPVEVSIGTIHLRLDAPAVQAGGRTPAPMDTNGPRSKDGPPPERSSLGRRALRRI